MARCEISRRTLLKSGGIALFAAAAGPLPAFLNRAVLAAPAAGARGKVLVVLFQRFGMDGVLAVTPFADARLARLRPNLVLSPPGPGKSDARLDLGGGYGLHPALAPLLPLYREGSLAIVHAAGSPHNTRSHTDAQLWWESGTPGDRSHRDGWLSRAIGAAGAPSADALRAVALTPERPRILYGREEVVSVASLGALALGGADAADPALAQIEQAYAQSENPLLRRAASGSFAVTRRLAEATRARASAADPGYPPNSALATTLREIAGLIHADVGLQVAFTESRTSPDGKGTWDTHSNAAALDGPFPAMASDLASSLLAFWRDLGDRAADVAVVTLTDFGRNVVENAGRGADHGRATAMFVLGGGVAGGVVHGTLPERFERDALEDQMDLPVTTDFRSVLASLTGAQLAIADDRAVFPGWTGERAPLLRS
jgi:uncharacterized protein (DUF1501 family)